jgi:CDP-diacylglycerol--serine O-phosphatidyltransferase
MPLFRRRRNAKGERLSRREWAREQLRKIAVLPTLMTLLNGVAGLAAIHAVIGYAHDPAGYKVWGVNDGFVIAAIFLILANIADSLDGRIARFTRQTTDFGGQLDSLCDVVSFGVAPAVLVYYLVVHEAAAAVAAGVLEPAAGRMLVQFTWPMAAAYFCCAALRLARFNVENVHDESAHLSFKGLPSPGAAVGVIMLAFLRSAFVVDFEGFHWSRQVLLWAASPITLGLGLLMVSRYRYPHLVNQYLNRRRSFAHLARMLAAGVLLAVITIAVGPAYSASAAVYAYIVGGAAVGISRQARGLPLSPSLPQAPAAAAAGGTFTSGAVASVASAGGAGIAGGAGPAPAGATPAGHPESKPTASV